MKKIKIFPIYHILYANYYYFSEFMRDMSPRGSFISKPKYEAIFLLSALEVFNIITFWIYLGYGLVTSNLFIDIAILFAAIYGLNYLYFIKIHTTENILKSVKSFNELLSTLGMLFSIIYFGGTFFLFYKIYIAR